MTIDVCDVYNYHGLPTLSSNVVIRQRFAAAWSAIGKLHPIFHSTAPDALKIELLTLAVKAIAVCSLYPPQSDDVGHARCRSSADDSRCTRHHLAEQHHERRSLRYIRSSVNQSNYLKKETSLDQPLIVSSESIRHPSRFNTATP